jgi:hypothetical protein
VPTAKIVAVLSDFNTDLSTIENAITFTTTANAIRPRLGTMLNWPIMDAPVRALAQQFMDLREPNVEGIFRGLYVNIAAVYEKLVRRLVTTGAILAGERAQAFDDLEDSLKQHNIYWTGKAFENIFGRRQHLNLDYYRLSSDIGTCIPGSQGFRINAEAFCVDVTTPTVESLDRILARIGIASYWDDVGRHRGMQRALGSSGVRETHRLAKDFLDKFVERRNTIVHAGHGAVALVERDVREAIDFFKNFAEALGDVVSTRIA